MFLLTSDIKGEIFNATKKSDRSGIEMSRSEAARLSTCAVRVRTISIMEVIVMLEVSQ